MLVILEVKSGGSLELTVEVETSSFFGKLLMSDVGFLGHTGERKSC